MCCSCTPTECEENYVNVPRVALRLLGVIQVERLRRIPEQHT